VTEKGQLPRLFVCPRDFRPVLASVITIELRENSAQIMVRRMAPQPTAPLHSKGQRPGGHARSANGGPADTARSPAVSSPILVSGIHGLGITVTPMLTVAAV
jgi:hypothetical protein